MDRLRPGDLITVNAQCGKAEEHIYIASACAHADMVCACLA